MEKEIWKDILGYEGKYQVSNLGNVKSLNYNRTGKEKILQVITTSKGYIRISLCKDGITKNYKVHRLVWTAFNGVIPDGMQVNHINEDKSDNRLSNLNLMTCKANINWGTGILRRCKLIVQYDLYGNLIKEWCSTIEAANELGIRQGHISECCLGKRKSIGGFNWKFKYNNR